MIIIDLNNQFTKINLMLIQIDHEYQMKLIKRFRFEDKKMHKSQDLNVTQSA